MELTSPLTTLRSISTPESYYTARGSPSNAAYETSLSSPVEEPPQESRYRDAVQLPHELKSHCQIHLEEQLYTAAIHILSGLLGDSAGAARPPGHPQPEPKPVRVPPPSQIALLATLIIHPSFTSRAPETSNTHAAAHALCYLRGLLGIAGPVNANFRAAFDFGGITSRNGSSNTSAPAYSAAVSASGSDSDSDSALSGAFAQSQLVFRRAPDFWAVLGWAFRCAAEYPHRWRHWRVWLEFVVGVLEADFDERLARDREAGKVGRGKSPRPYPLLGASLVVGYLEGLRRERRNVVRELMRAVLCFSDGENGAADRAVFREVFERETATVRGKSKRKRGEEVVLDLENDRFGDYLDGEEFESEEEGEGDAEKEQMAMPRARKRPGRKPKGQRTTATSSFTLTDCVAETVPFRLRIFRLLSATALYLPDALTRVDELYERFTSHVRGLPLPTFRLFVESSQLPPDLPESARVTLLRMVIEDLLPAHLPRPDDVEKLDQHGVTVPIMRECFLPFAANKVTAEDNAKLSLALESLMWYIYSEIEIEYDESLRRAVEKGIKAREDRIRRRGGGVGKADAADTEAREALARSSRNLRALVDIIAVTGR